MHQHTKLWFSSLNRSFLEVQFCRYAPRVASQCSESDLGADDFVGIFVSKDLYKDFLSVVHRASTDFVDKDFCFAHVCTPIVGTSTIEDLCALVGDFGEHPLKGLFYGVWVICHCR